MIRLIPAAFCQMRNLWLVWVLVVSALSTGSVPACTTAVISGRATPDGRPLLWKNRDAPHKHNEVIMLTGGRYRAVAVVNANQRKSVWMGTNERGFCIENSLSRDLTEKDAEGPGNGVFMRRALLSCATVDDFEELLRATDGERATNTNYGVIDASGGAAIFETRGSQFVKFDANDPAIAPDGYLVRSNFSATGQQPEFDFSEAAVGELYSGERYLRGCRLIESGRESESGITAQYLLVNCCRDLADVEGNPIPLPVDRSADEPPLEIDTAATISRRTSVSAAVFQGVRRDEHPLCTTMWVIMGEPIFSVAVPCWVAADGVAPELDGDDTSPLCTAVRTLREANYRKRDGAKYLQSRALPAILAETQPVEEASIATAESMLRQWRLNGPDPTQMTRVHRQASAAAMEVIQRLVESSMEPAGTLSSEPANLDAR